MLDDNIPQPWRARSTLVLTLTLVAVGLGNVQRLPFLIGEHGGGTFFLGYVLALCALSVPVMVAEVALGSHGRASPGLALHWAASTANRDTRWRHLATAQALLALVLAAVAILTSVWCLHWAGVLYSGVLASASAIDIAGEFLAYVDNRPALFANTLMLSAAAGAVSALGIRLGLGFVAWVCLPAVAITLLGVLDFVFIYTDMRPVEEFLFASRADHWRADSLWRAVSAAGVTLGAGLGLGMALGAQSPTGLPWGRSVLAVAIIDTGFMLVTAVIVSALLFETNVAPAEGLAALFTGLPYAFANLPLGETYGALFFGAMALIAWGAAAVLLEPMVMLLADEWQLGRVSGAILSATLVAMVIAGSLFMGELPLLQLGSLITEWLLPISLLATAVFVGWLMPRPVLRGELFREPKWLFQCWWIALRWLVPTGCVVWLLGGTL
ncbi:MAG: sodium-dependent transporter [Congregibacter sp.]|nr:sodium-dependent transporter [Congregibacter sp.]